MIHSRVIVVLLGLLGWMVQACAPKPATTGTRINSGSYNDYSEDLAAARPVYNPPKRETATRPPRPTAPATKPTELPRKEATPVVIETLSVNRQLDAVLDTMATQNRRVRYAPGFRVQVYVGNERAAADAAKLQLYQQFPELSAYVTYQQPTYRLKVGDFMRRMDAERYFGKLKTVFAGAQLQPDKVDMRRGLLIK
jgi:hypothetical protein